MSDQTYEKIEKLVIEITTCEERRSDTDNPVELYVGGHKWQLDMPKYDEFEKGRTDVFELDVPDNFDSSNFQYLCFRKKTYTGKDDDWCIEKIKLIVNDVNVYEKDSLNAWLKGEKTSWCAPDFTYGKAGE